MLRSHCQSCGCRDTLCHAMSPHGPIPPPIKRARILVSCVVVTVILVKFIVFYVITIAAKRVDAKLVVGYRRSCRKIPVSRHPPTRANPNNTNNYCKRETSRVLEKQTILRAEHPILIYKRFLVIFPQLWWIRFNKGEYTFIGPPCETTEQKMSRNRPGWATGR
jgi:hypothetical protein